MMSDRRAEGPGSHDSVSILFRLIAALKNMLGGALSALKVSG